jgi:hypothetical protein
MGVDLITDILPASARRVVSNRSTGRDGDAVAGMAWSKVFAKQAFGLTRVRWDWLADGGCPMLNQWNYCKAKASG